MAPNRTFLRVLQRTLTAIGAAAALWTAAIWILDGFEFQLGPVAVRAHRLDRSMTLAVAALLLAHILNVRLSGRNALREWAPLTQRAARSVFLRAWVHVRIALAYRPPPGVWSLLLVSATALAGVAASVYVWSVAPPLWLDEEAISLNVRDRGFAELAGPLWLGQSAPLGWLIVQRAVMLAFGTGELSLRFMPLAFGLATIGVAIWIGRRWLGAWATAVLVLLCGFGQWIVHYRFEVKHYTSDTFWSLLLPALVVWTIEASTASARLRRATIWWLSAALGLWLSNGATLVAPGCALLLVGYIWRRDGTAAAAKVAAVGSIWLVAFGAHYELSMQDTLQSQYLRDFWANRVPESSMGLADRAQWVVDRFHELGSNPAGAEAWKLFWISAAAGFAFSKRRMLAGAFALVPATAFVLGAGGVVPLYERLALWMVPALYVGLALLVDEVVRVVRESYSARRWLVLAAAMGVGALEIQLCTEMVKDGRRELRGASWSDQKQGLNDRLAVRWLIRQLRPGDAIVSTHQAWPAVWWYGQIRLGDDADRRTQWGPGIAEYEIQAASARDCRPDEFTARLSDHGRALVYLGFRDIPAGADRIIMKRFEEAGTISAFRVFGSESWAGIVDLRVKGQPSAFHLPPRPNEPEPAPANLCVSVQRTSQW